MLYFKLWPTARSFNPCDMLMIKLLMFWWCSTSRFVSNCLTLKLGINLLNVWYRVLDFIILEKFWSLIPCQLILVLCGYWNQLMWYFPRTLDIQESCFIIMESRHPLYVYCNYHFHILGISNNIAWLHPDWAYFVSRWAITSLTSFREVEQ